MTKAELVSTLAAEVDVNKTTAAVILDSIKAILTRDLKKTGETVLHGIGIFKVKKRAARTGRNPQTGAPVKIPAHRSVAFKAHKALKDALA
jgi:DNA-binding protein HU-beta